MSLVVNDFVNSSKAFLRIPKEVDQYDLEITNLIESAIQTLKIAGIETKTPLVTEFISTFVRLRMMQDASDTFVNSEKERELELLSVLTYGGVANEG